MKTLEASSGTGERLTPGDFIYTQEFEGYPIAQRNVYAVAGHRAEALMHNFVSGNTSNRAKTDAAKKFLAMTGVHPQAIVEEIQRINTPWLNSKRTNPKT